MPLEIVLVEPEIPQNTGNIVRTCVATGLKLHLIEPLGFSITEKAVRRAGLDYWFDADVTVWKDFNSFMENNKRKKMYFSTTKAPLHYAAVNYPDDCMILFGKETKGLNESLLAENRDTCIRIPMKDNTRSLNLSNAVAIVAYEYLRQKDFVGLKSDGKHDIFAQK